MSYILDALRKADAQRQRTRLPGLHAQPSAAAPEAAAPAWRSPIAWLLAGGLLLAMLVLAWPGSQTAPAAVPAVVAAPPTSAPVAVAEQPAPQAPAPVVATAIQPAPAPPRPAADTAPREPVGPATPRERVAARTAPARTAPARTAPGPAAAAPAAGNTASPESSTPPPGAPKLAITGGVYSADPAQRLLIVGGQVFNEGSEVAPGVKLEQVRPGQALLSYQGQRFTARY